MEWRSGTLVHRLVQGGGERPLYCLLCLGQTESGLKRELRALQALLGNSPLYSSMKVSRCDKVFKLGKSPNCYVLYERLDFQSYQELWLPVPKQPLARGTSLGGCEPLAEKGKGWLPLTPASSDSSWGGKQGGVPGRATQQSEAGEVGS